MTHAGFFIIELNISVIKLAIQIQTKKIEAETKGIVVEEITTTILRIRKMQIFIRQLVVSQMGLQQLPFIEDLTFPLIHVIPEVLRHFKDQELQNETSNLAKVNWNMNRKLCQNF